MCQKRLGHIILNVVILCFILGCKKSDPILDKEEDVVARVQDRVLSLPTLNQIIHSNTKPEDSTAMANAYIDQWTRDQLVMQEASRLFSTDKEVERLVMDYRESLLKHKLEEKIIAERFDTTITSAQLELFYSDMKSQFTLSNDLYQCAFYKFSRETRSLGQFYKDWKKEDEHAIRTFAAAYGVEQHSDTTRWFTWSEIQEMHGSFVKTIADRLQGQRQIDKEYQYFLKIFEKVDKGTFSPLEYIAPQLSRMLLHKRKQNILDAYKQELYEKALRDNIVRLRI